MARSILARHRVDALDFTASMTAAQRAAVEADLATNPAALADPEAAAAIATSCGFAPALPRPSPGAELLRRAKG